GNDWACAVALLAGWKHGATVAPLDPLLKADERAEILADLRPTLLIDAAIVGGLGRGGAGGPGRRSGTPSWVTEPSGSPRAATPEPAHAGVSLYTAGSTGRPEGAGVARGGLELALEPRA